MKAKVTMMFNDDAVDEFAKMFDIKDYSKIPAVLEAVLRASPEVEDNYEQLDNMTVEMVE